jgi:hypothetical protein
MGALCGRRLADAIVLPDREARLADRRDRITIAPGERVVVLQTKDSRLGMYLMGQTLFSAELLRRRFPEALIESVALCTKDDEILRPLLEAHSGCRVIIAPQTLRRKKREESDGLPEALGEPSDSSLS